MGDQTYERGKGNSEAASPSGGRSRLDSLLRRILAPSRPPVWLLALVILPLTLLILMAVGISAAFGTEAFGTILGISMALGVTGAVVGFAVVVLVRWALLPELIYNAPLVVALPLSYLPYALGAMAGTAGSLLLRRYLPLGFQPVGGPGTGMSLTMTVALWLVLGLVCNQANEGLRRVREYREQLRARLVELEESRRRIVSAQETVRRVVAERLHGRVQSRLLLIGFKLRETAEKCDPTPEARERLQEAQERLNDLVEDVRTISHELHPSILRLGLLPALRSLVEGVEDSLSATLEVGEEVAKREGPDGPGFPSEVRVALFRVVRESLLNVVKHAQATRVTIRLYMPSETKIQMVVEDDGRGFEPAEQTGLGIRIVEDYVQIAGGTLQVDSAPGKGTRVTVSLPLDAGGPAQDEGPSEVSSS